MLRTLLENWTDADVAQFSLGVALGLYDANEQMSDYKRVFWSNNPTGNALALALDALAAGGILERRDDRSLNLQFRWANRGE